jgi:N-acetylglucosamine-6-phosphate deacetylase
VVRIIDIAPELKGAMEASVYLRENGILVSLGHSDADYTTAQKFMKENFNHFTHFYNAMSPFEHRDGGMVGAGLLSDNSKLEIIADLYHIHREAIEMCVRNRGWENIILITDSISATGMKDGLYDLGGLKVQMYDGKCHLENSETIAGSTLTLDKAISNLINSGYSTENFIGSLTLNPALSLGLRDRGKLEPGFRADFCVLNENKDVEKTYVKGRIVYSKQ